jgi:polyphosphate kinase 2
MIHKFINFLNEEIRIGKIDLESLNKMKENLVDRLDEYKEYVLSNIKYDIRTNKVIYDEGFDNINISIILRELRNEFTPELIEDLNLESFLRKIYQIIDLRKRNTKKQIRSEFIEYYISLDNRIKKLIIKSTEVNQNFGEAMDDEDNSILSRKEYESEKYDIQVELLKLQEWVMKNKKKVAICFEGRDAAGKGSTIKRFTEYLQPKGFKVVALGPPTPEEKKDWFGRYEKYLPNDGEIVFFDRSWYNRAVVEPAMGYCTENQYMEFMDSVLSWEESLIDDGVILIKLWFSITKEKQLLRFEMRQKSPLKYWKYSPNDAKVVDKWDIITKYKNQMLNNTSSNKSPWIIINSNDKRIGMLNAMRYVLWNIEYDNKDESISEWYPEVVNIIK